MQLVLVKSQEPDLQEAWEMHVGTETLTGHGHLSDPAFCQSNRNAEAFVSIIRALAATAHRLPQQFCPY